VTKADILVYRFIETGTYLLTQIGTGV
jgi:hypothetical protein